ncbi:MAG: hypothetical protein ABIK09_17565 [Pseudomonadota bacterium]
MIRFLSLALFLATRIPAGLVAQEAPPPEAAPVVEEAPLTVSLYPPPLQSKERLRRLILELWCADRRGANDAELVQLYLKHSYPPLQDWHKLYNRALEDSPWVRSLYDEVRATCPIPEDELPPGTLPEQ